jgi:hypothetical protein
MKIHGGLRRIRLCHERLLPFAFSFALSFFIKNRFKFPLYHFSIKAQGGSGHGA